MLRSLKKKKGRESNNLLLKTEFIESLEKYTDDSNKLKDLKIEWIESKNKLGQYEDIISEIDLIIDNQKNSYNQKHVLNYQLVLSMFDKELHLL